MENPSRLGTGVISRSAPDLGLIPAKPFLPNPYYIVEDDKAMGLDRIFRMVAEGHKRLNGNNLWLCPLCQRQLESPSREECDRHAVVHCLTHAGEPGDMPAILDMLKVEL